MSHDGQTFCKSNDAAVYTMVAESNRIIWSICEDDVRVAALDKGLQLNEWQMEDVARYVERELSAVCNWFMVVEMALSEVVLTREAGHDRKLQYERNGR